MSGLSPIVVRRQLGRRLQQLRELAGKTAADVDAAHLGSPAKISRVERGQVPVKVSDVVAWCRLYGADDTEIDSLAALAIGTSARDRWENYGDVIPDWFKLYIGLEATAARIQTVEESVVPGELQTSEYARAVYRAERPDEDAAAIERYVEVRLDRQKALLNRKPPPQIIAVLGQGAITRAVGGPSVLAEQVEYLRELDKRDNIEIRILKFDAGAHAAMAGAFRILDFDDAEDPDLVYLETLMDARYLDKEADLKVYRRVFKMIYSQAVPIGEL
jgi:hypothetical protein